MCTIQHYNIIHYSRSYFQHTSSFYLGILQIYFEIYQPSLSRLMDCIIDILFFVSRIYIMIYSQINFGIKIIYDAIARNTIFQISDAMFSQPMTIDCCSTRTHFGKYIFKFRIPRWLVAYDQVFDKGHEDTDHCVMYKYIRVYRQNNHALCII